MNPAQIDSKLASDTLLAHPLVAAQMLCSLIEAGLNPAAAGFSSGFIRALALSLCALNPDLDRQGDRVERALKDLTERLLPFSGANDAWLDGVSAAGKAGSPENPSRLAVVSPDFFGDPPSAKSLLGWIEAGLIRFHSAECARNLSDDVPGLFANPLGARVFRRFLPGGSGRRTSTAFAPTENDASIVCDMIKCGVFFRLAAEYDQADRHGLASALEKRLSLDTKELAASRPPRSGSDPLYARLLSWSAQRVASNTDWIRGAILFRGADCATDCRALMLSGAQTLLEADDIEASLAPTPKRSRKRAL